MVRIIAHFTNDEKRKIALKIMPKGSVTQSYVLGEAEDYEIEVLEDHGLIVEHLEEEPEAETPGRQAEYIPSLQRGLRRWESEALDQEPPRYPEDPNERGVDEEEPNFYLIRLQ
jgi:hypothetical protein